MSGTLDPIGDSEPASSLTGPLSSVDIPSPARTVAPGIPADLLASAEALPLALRHSRPAPEREIPAHRYDPVAQVAVDPEGRPMTPNLAKDWTSLDGTHTDGDGGDNETWAWEE
ncbi:putative ATP-grasp-modified RiPP [Amycolatopsis sp. NPDC004079]|uniref:putative ATP-grasp-modified RiPP n=1 Tax=Amycolatopsis sp. NPDC004079 TaxID=3154549 RepID=UPI0033BF90EB